MASRSIRVDEETYQELVRRGKAESRTIRAVLRLALGVERGGLHEMPGTSAAAVSRVVRGVSSGEHAGDASEVGRVTGRGASASEREDDGERVSETGEVGAAAVRGVRGNAGGKAPRRLREAAGGAVAVSGTPPGVDKPAVVKPEPSYDELLRARVKQKGEK